MFSARLATTSPISSSVALASRAVLMSTSSTSPASSAMVLDSRKRVAEAPEYFVCNMSDVAQRISSAEHPAEAIASDSRRGGGLTTTLDRMTLDRPQSLSRRAYSQILQAIRDETIERDRSYSENELAVSL